MAKPKWGYILATFFLSSAAAAISFVSLGTQGWVTANARLVNNIGARYDDFIKFGLFAGSFHQQSAAYASYELTMTCRFDLNVCALLCGDNKENNLEKLYKYNEDDETESDRELCVYIPGFPWDGPRPLSRADSTTNSGRTFINFGVWLCTLIFLTVSAAAGLSAAGLGLWNSASTPRQAYFGVAGLYIVNAVALFSLLLAIVLWGAMYAHDLIPNIPCYQTFLDGFSTKNSSQLGYSYWLLIVSLTFYLLNIYLLYVRSYSMSNQQKKVTIPTENDDVRIRLNRPS